MSRRRSARPCPSCGSSSARAAARAPSGRAAESLMPPAGSQYSSRPPNASRRRPRPRARAPPARRPPWARSEQHRPAACPSASTLAAASNGSRARDLEQLGAVADERRHRRSRAASRKPGFDQLDERAARCGAAASLNTTLPLARNVAHLGQPERLEVAAQLVVGDACGCRGSCLSGTPRGWASRPRYPARRRPTRHGPRCREAQAAAEAPTRSARIAARRARWRLAPPSSAASSCARL